MAENLTPKELPPDLDPVTIRALERLRKTWDVLKTLDEKHNIERLRLRADIAENIRDIYNSGGKRSDVAETLGISLPRVTRLVQGNYNFGPAAVHRKGQRSERLEPIETNPPKVTKEAPKPKCKYCGDDAKFRVETDRGVIFTCRKHKPPS